MYKVFEVFPDGKRFYIYGHYDYFNCEVWARNHSLCTTALKNGWSKLVIEYEKD